MRLERYALMAAAMVAALACQTSQPDDVVGGGDRAEMEQPVAGITLTGNRQEDERTIRRLEEEARRLARTDGCEQDGQCAAAPVGAKACGGPRSYVTYCTLTTDVDALHAKLDELHRTEQAYNLRYEIVSDCMLVMEPPVAAVNSVCTAQQ